MSDLYATNYTKRDRNVPRDFIPPKDVSGNILISRDEYAVASTDEVTSGDIIYTGIRIPKGARIIDAGMQMPATGATGKFKMGIVGDDDGLIAEIDPGAANAFVRADALSTLVGDAAAADMDIIITCTETTADAGGKTLQAWVLFQYI